ncbi:MAG: membrane protein insertion efficiency factor YidD [Kangiella sp.]|nr:MAG: membrane protein insertion efficiency factor YidD [Kangiella sp.]
MLSVLALRTYRKCRPRFIGDRCVFEPSCSHYCELAIRENGFFRGVKLTFNRLYRCKPGAGGIDLSCKKVISCNTK